MRQLRRKRAAPASAPPVTVPNALPLYRAMFPELGVTADTPTVQLHTADCAAAVSHARAAWPPEGCTCPGGSGYPRTVATVADGSGPVDEAGAETARAMGLL